MPHRKFFRLWRPTKLLLPAICLSAALCYAQQAAIIDGHTHIAETLPRGGLTLINPGSAARPAYGVPTYAYTVVNGKKAVTTLVEL